MIATFVTRFVLSMLAGPGVRGPAPLPLRLDLNVPAYRLEVYRESERIRSYAVAVGAPEYPTPIGEFAVTEITWNPWWFPPPSAWAREERAAPPGPNNPMGRVKLRFGPLVFLHGTPLEGSLGSAASHACVRMANADAIELARLIHSVAPPPLATSTIDWLLGDVTRTREVRLLAPVPLRVRYEIAEIRGDSLLLHPDVYGRARRPIDEAVVTLARHGYPVETLDAEAIDGFVAASLGGRAEVPVTSLLRHPAQPEPPPSPVDQP